MSFYHPLFMFSTIILLLRYLDIVNCLQTPSSPSNNNKINIDIDSLPTLFKPAYSDAAKTLSPTGITSMMPITATATANDNDKKVSNSSGPLRQNLFTSPIIPALYEKILPPLWSAGLRIGGPDAEYQSAARYLNDADGSNSNGDGLALDLSCGTGFVGRRMAFSRKFRHVFCLDYSREMLDECLRSIEREEKEGVKETRNLSLSLIRGDAGNLPFRDGVLDAVHWGAAMHCVPNAERAMEEVYRVLKPDGGRLYATTFLKPFPDIVFRFFTVRELEELTRGAGFEGGKVEVDGRGVYGIIRARK